MSKADKIEETIVDVAILGAGTAAILAFIGHCKKMAEKEDGVGAIDKGEYLIRARWNDGRYGNIRIFCGYKYDTWTGEKYAKWNNPAYKYGSEYNEKIFKTYSGAEKAIEELIRIGENEWNSIPVKFDIITWEDYVSYLRMR